MKLKAKKLNLREIWKVYQKCKPLLEDDKKDVFETLKKFPAKDFFDCIEIIFGSREPKGITILSLIRGCAENGLAVFGKFVKGLTDNGVDS